MLGIPDLETKDVGIPVLLRQDAQVLGGDHGLLPREKQVCLRLLWMGCTDRLYGMTACADRPTPLRSEKIQVSRDRFNQIAVHDADEPVCTGRARQFR